jgi:hypothetical protein
MFSLFGKTCGNKKFITYFNNFIYINRLTEYIRTPIIASSTIFTARTVLYCSIENKTTCTSLRNL